VSHSGSEGGGFSVWACSKAGMVQRHIFVEAGGVQGSRMWSHTRARGQNNQR
jgi:hypothetical protein